MLDIFVAALLAPAISAPKTVFTCRAGRKEISITLDGDRLTYTYGRPGKPEINLIGGPDGGVSYHPELYARGEDQTLRFLSDGWSYVIFNRYQAPPPNQQGTDGQSPNMMLRGY